MTTTDPAEAHALLEALPLGRRYDDIRTYLGGPPWPLGLMLREPAKSQRLCAFHSARYVRCAP
jgi:hypothetical protein